MAFLLGEGKKILLIDAGIDQRQDILLSLSLDAVFVESFVRNGNDEDDVEGSHPD
jgi:hypothetical protein